MIAYPSISTTHIYVKPKSGYSIFDPDLDDYLPPEGRDVSNTDYWMRRLRDSDVEISEPPGSEVPPDTSDQAGRNGDGDLTPLGGDSDSTDNPSGTGDTESPIRGSGGDETTDQPSHAEDVNSNRPGRRPIIRHPVPQNISDNEEDAQ